MVAMPPSVTLQHHSGQWGLANAVTSSGGSAGGEIGELRKGRKRFGIAIVEIWISSSPRLLCAAW